MDCIVHGVTKRSDMTKHVRKQYCLLPGDPGEGLSLPELQTKENSTEDKNYSNLRRLIFVSNVRRTYRVSTMTVHRNNSFICIFRQLKWYSFEIWGLYIF